MEFNSRLLKLNDDADIMEELKGLTPEQIRILKILGKPGKMALKISGESGILVYKISGESGKFLLVIDYLQFMIIFAGKYERYGKKSI